MKQRYHLARSSRHLFSMAAWCGLALCASARQAHVAPDAVDTSDLFGGGGKTNFLACGSAIDIQDDVLIGGSFKALVSGQGSSGTVTVFRHGSFWWTDEQTLFASDGQQYDSFGYAVAMSGPVIVVGAPFDDVGGNSNQGSAMVFRNNGTSWVEEQRIFAATGQPADNFGVSVAVQGDVIVVGASNDDLGTGLNQGSATVFRWNGTIWQETQTLTASSPGDNEAFGGDVELSGTTLAIGEPFAHVGGATAAGAVHVYRLNGTTYNLEQELTPAGTLDYEFFGNSISVAGDVLVAGSHGANSHTGTATIYRWNGAAWMPEQQLSQVNGMPDDFFGMSVATNGHVVVVGSMRDDIGGNMNQGSAHVFRHGPTGWVWEGSLTSSVGTADDNFGASVEFDGETVLVAAPRSWYKKPAAGAAVVFPLHGGYPWSDQGSALGGNFGSPRLFCEGGLAGGSTVLLDLNLAAPSTLAGLLVSSSSTPLPLFGGTILAFPFEPPILMWTSPTGTLKLPATVPVGMPTGLQLWLQWILFDPAAPQGFAISNAVMGVTP